MATDIIITGTKSAGTWLYANDIKQENIPLVATEWTYVIEYPIAGVNVIRFYTEDLQENRSASVITSYIHLEDNMESIVFSKEDLLKIEKFSRIKLDNLILEEKYGTDPETGQSIITESFLKVE